MARITEELLRKSAEHNESEIFTLEELSLHQRDLIKLEHLDKWCKDLKILYLHNNLISKIENLSRLKKLEYVNFTLNNITKIENLDGCESLKKLDFTVNFIGQLTSVENLKENYNLEELYLTGNPCSEFEGYRDFVIAALPQLKKLDGEVIKASERITAMQKYHVVRGYIIEQQRNYMKKMGKTDEEIYESIEECCSDAEESCSPKSDNSFWNKPTKHSPQSRIEMYKHLQKTRSKDEKEKKKPKRAKILFTEDGRPLNVNEPKLNFEFTEDEENNCYILDLAVYRYLSTSLLQADVHPNYVRVLVKGKVFQLHLPKEVQPDFCTSLRSQTTGHLVITMPKIEDILIPRNSFGEKKNKDINIRNSNCRDDEKSKTLEVTPSVLQSLSEIVNESSQQKKTKELEAKALKNTAFLDNPDVPPLI